MFAIRPQNFPSSADDNWWANGIWGILISVKLFSSPPLSLRRFADLPSIWFEYLSALQLFCLISNWFSSSLPTNYDTLWLSFQMLTALSNQKYSFNSRLSLIKLTKIHRLERIAHTRRTQIHPIWNPQENSSREMRIGVISYQIEINVVCHLHSNLHVEWRRRNTENLEKFVFVVDSLFTPHPPRNSSSFLIFAYLMIFTDWIVKFSRELEHSHQPSATHSTTFSSRLPTMHCVTSIALEIIVLSKIARRFLNFSSLPSSWKSDFFGRIFHLNNFPRVERKFKVS